MPDIFIAPKTTPSSSSLRERKKRFGKKHPHPAAPLGKAHIFSSFCQNPTDISFKEQEKGEKILLFLRRHFITNIPWILGVFVLIIIPPLITALNSVNILSEEIFSFIKLPIGFTVLFFLLYYLLVFAYAFVNFISWYFNVSLITEKRVVDINFSDLVYKNVSATKLGLVQDASFLQIGAIQSLFDYGDVLIQTAGSLDNFNLKAVPCPEKTVQIVESLIGKGPDVS